MLEDHKCNTSNAARAAKAGSLKEDFGMNLFIIFIQTLFFSGPKFSVHMRTCFVNFEAEGNLANKVTGNDNMRKFMDIENFPKIGLYLLMTTGSQDI